ncbi:hypothetical protein [Aurantiacibacter poecillastricola]|nr:hypothetical protein [Aurantiacibacter sp. 219JJ12-13]MDP5262713.1 hypothetical protein [Aurantiacibacter sp. 219JJ12-13]
MREALDQWLFVYAALGITLAGTLALVLSSWHAMRRAEKRREETRKR